MSRPRTRLPKHFRLVMADRRGHALCRERVTVRTTRLVERVTCRRCLHILGIRKIERRPWTRPDNAIRAGYRDDFTDAQALEALRAMGAR